MVCTCYACNLTLCGFPVYRIDSAPENLLTTPCIAQYQPGICFGFVCSSLRTMCLGLYSHWPVCVIASYCPSLPPAWVFHVPYSFSEVSTTTLGTHWQLYDWILTYRLHSFVAKSEL